MASPPTHIFAATSLGLALLPGRLERRVLIAAAICSLLPDVDVVWHLLGVPYDHPLGHRGLTHSLPFAALLAALAQRRISPPPGRRLRIGLLLFVAAASHGVFDAMTNGGRGIAFFAPLHNGRYFLPFRPVNVSPTNLEALRPSRLIPILSSEVIWIWLPWALLCAVVFLAVRLGSGELVSSARSAARPGG